MQHDGHGLGMDRLHQRALGDPAFFTPLVWGPSPARPLSEDPGERRDDPTELTRASLPRSLVRFRQRVLDHRKFGRVPRRAGNDAGTIRWKDVGICVGATGAESVGSAHGVRGRTRNAKPTSATKTLPVRGSGPKGSSGRQKHNGQSGLALGAVQVALLALARTI